MEETGEGQQRRRKKRREEKWREKSSGLEEVELRGGGDDGVQMQHVDVADSLDGW